jgi:hypothetical protein
MGCSGENTGSLSRQFRLDLRLRDIGRRPKGHRRGVSGRERGRIRHYRDFSSSKRVAPVWGGTPLCACPGLIPRGTLEARPVQRRGGSLPLVPRRRLPDLNLSRLIYHGLHTRCLRFEAPGYPDATQDSLPVGGQPLPGRARTYWVHDEGFQVLSTACSFLPSQAWPGARHLFGGPPRALGRLRPVRGGLPCRCREAPSRDSRCGVPPRELPAADAVCGLIGQRGRSGPDGSLKSAFLGGADGGVVPGWGVRARIPEV